MMFGVVSSMREATIPLVVSKVNMSLLYGYDLQIRAVEGGNVTIKAIT